jgi:hypothetical protein
MPLILRRPILSESGSFFSRRVEGVRFAAVDVRDGLGERGHVDAVDDARVAPQRADLGPQILEHCRDRRDVRGRRRRRACLEPVVERVELGRRRRRVARERVDVAPQLA